MKHLSALVFSACLLIVAVFAIGGEPEPHWDCSEGKGDKVLWRAELGGRAGRASVGEGVVLVGTNNERPRDLTIVGDHGILMAFAAKNGQYLWQVDSPRLPVRTNDIPGEPGASRPFIADERAYYTTNNGQLVCVKLTGGAATQSVDRVAWRLDMIHTLGVFKRDAGDFGNPLPAPLVVGDLVFTVTGNGVDNLSEPPPCPEAPSFLAVDKRSGRVIWSSYAPGKEIHYAQWSSPAYAKVDGEEQILFPGGDGRLYAFEPLTGKPLWNVLVSEPDKVHQSYTPVIVAPPVVDMAEGVVYVSLNRDWESAGFPGHALLAIDLRTHLIRWRFDDKDFGGTFGEVAISGTQLYVLGSSSGLFALDRKTGKRIWQDKLDENAGAAHGSPVVADGKVYVAGDDSIYVLEADAHRTRVGVYQLDGVIEGSPLISDGRLLVTTRAHLWALKPVE